MGKPRQVQRHRKAPRPARARPGVLVGEHELVRQPPQIRGEGTHLQTRPARPARNRQSGRTRQDSRRVIAPGRAAGCAEDCDKKQPARVPARVPVRVPARVPARVRGTIRGRDWEQPSAWCGCLSVWRHACSGPSLGKAGSSVDSGATGGQGWLQTGVGHGLAAGRGVGHGLGVTSAAVRERSRTLRTASKAYLRRQLNSGAQEAETGAQGGTWAEEEAEKGASDRFSKSDMESNHCQTVSGAFPRAGGT